MIDNIISLLNLLFPFCLTFLLKMNLFRQPCKNGFFVYQAEFKNFTIRMIIISKYKDTLFPGPKQKCFPIDFEFTFYLHPSHLKDYYCLIFNEACVSYFSFCNPTTFLYKLQFQIPSTIKSIKYTDWCTFIIFLNK